MVLLILFQIYLGALVAGLDAGMSYNSWPLMDGAVVPGGLMVQQPWWINLFENPKTVQFVHRMVAYGVLLAALWHMLATLKRDAATPHSTRAIILFLLVLGQAALGIVTLLSQVHLHTALAHQGMALIVLGFASAHWRGAKGPYPLPTQVVERG